MMMILLYLLYGVLGLVALLLLVALILPANYKVARSLEFKQSPEQIYPEVADLKKYLHWNPWSAQEPTATNTFEGEGKGASWAWDGKVVGKGKMTIEELVDNQRIKHRIDFFKPMTTTAKNEWTFEKNSSGGTKIVWTMEGNNPYPIGRYFGLMMDKMIGKDFENGLANLKAIMDKKEG
jgi:ribosome-associated toxin RatA of RatAB toxin-antitoxin module